jgi:hypothetical protein
MRTLRKLVLGETWALPVGIAVAVGVAAIVRAAAGPAGWWDHAGGFVLLVLLVGAFAAALGFRR